MALQQTIISDMTQAMKDKDKFTLSVLRMLKSALQLEQITKKHELVDEEVIAVIKKQVKMRKDSITEFTKYGKDEEVASLNQEVEVLSKYLPEELSEEELVKIIDAVFEELQPSTMKDMGRTVKEIGARTAGRADMSQVSALVKARLQ
ncbi:MAG: GatB/YqeY domain-containing protein [Candidatus Coprovivens sp.]